MVVAGAFRYTDRYGSFAVPVKMVFVNDNDNRCISGVFGWDFGLVLSKVFVAYVRQLNAIFVFYLIFFLSNFENVPRSSGFRCCAR